jgi:predicted nucleic acid-binding Zn ribbon protein
MSSGPYDPLPIGKVLDEHTRRFGMGEAKQVGELFSSWPRIVGPAMADHVEPVSLRKGVLKLVADSPTWATEITYLSEQIRKQANAALGSDVIERIEVGAGARRGGRNQSSDDAKGAPRGPEKGVSERPATDDPMTAFERARAAWLRRRSKGR